MRRDEMNKIKRVCIFTCMALLGIGIVLLGAWDMQRATAAQPEVWYQGTDLQQPVAYYGSAQCPDDPDSFYVVAGWQSWFVNRDEVWRYDVDTAIWTQLADFPEAMGVVSVTCYQGYIYAAGGSLGYDTSWHFYRYEIATDIWTQLDDLPRKQNGAALAAWDGYLFMIGGVEAATIPIDPTTQVDRYNLQTGIWEINWGTLMPVETVGNWLQAGRYVYIVGGYTANFPVNSDATLRYDLATDKWDVGPSFGSRRALMALDITSQYLYAIGGDTNGGGSHDETDLVERLDLSAWPWAGWVDISDPLPAPREANYGFCSEVLAGGEIWSMGGVDTLENPTTEIYYRPSEACYNWPPQVLEEYPAPNSHDAEVDTPVSITYDMDMDPATVVPVSFAVHARQTGWLTETLSVDGGTISLQPTSSLHAGELVQVTATTATLSLDGEAPVEPTVWEFTTAPWNGIAEFSEHQIMQNDISRYIALGDLDGDGDLDALTTSCTGFTRVYQNDGSGTFTDIQDIPYLSSCPLDANLGDLDGDGDLDAVLIDYNIHGLNRILLNNGNGHFTESINPIPGQFDTYGELGDLDGDGDLDLFVVSGGFETGSIRVWKNNGLAFFTMASDFDTVYEHTGVALGDLDADGDLDAFTTGWGNTYNKVWLNDGSGAFSEAQVIPDTNTYYPLLGDLNGDGYLDAYLSNGAYPADFPDEVWLNDGTGHFTDSGQHLETVSSAIPALGDLDADGDLDVYISGSYDFADQDEVWTNDGTGNFSMFSTVDENYPGGFVSLGDLDSDGDLDAFVGSQFTVYGYQVYLNTAWMPAGPLSVPIAANLVQCVEAPGSFYMVGGISTGNVTSDQLSRYDIAADVWVQLSPLPGLRRAVAATCYQGKIYVAGGADYFIYGTFYIYDIASNTWTSGPNLPNIVWGAAMGAWDGKLYLVGGTREGDPYTPVSRVDIFDLASGEWTPGGGQSMLTAASFFGSVQTGIYLYAVGGSSGDFSHNVDQTQRYNMATNLWELGPQFTSARALAPLAATRSHLYMLGGDLDGGGAFDATNLVEELDLSTWPAGTWTDLHDPLPDPNIYPATTCTEILTGGEIWAVGGVNSSFEVFNSNYYRHAEPCASFGVDLPEPWWGGFGEAGTMVEYWLIITNTGVVTDYYTLEVSTTYGIGSILGGPGPIGPGDSMLIAIDVEIPSGAQPGDHGTTEILATSISNLTVFDVTTITTTVGLRDFDLQTIPPDSQEDHPGNVLTYTLLVSNIGDFKDGYNVEISSTWETTASLSIGPLLPGENNELVVVVTIPQDAEAGDWDFAVITLSSQVKPLISHSAKLTSTAVWHRMLMPLAMRN
jgi:hypothetical protein